MVKKILRRSGSQHHGYLGVNAHYIHEFKRRKFNLACKKFDEAHTSENIWAKLSEVLDNFKLKDLIYLALHDAANNIKACFYTEECDIEAQKYCCLWNHTH